MIELKDDEVLTATCWSTSTGAAHLPHTQQPLVAPMGPTPCAPLQVEVAFDCPGAGEEPKMEEMGGAMPPSSRCRRLGGARCCQSDASWVIMTIVYQFVSLYHRAHRARESASETKNQSIASGLAER